MPADIRDRTAIVGVGTSRFGTFPDESPLRLAAQAFRAALADAGLTKDAVDGLAINIGWPLGVDYDRFVEALGLNVRFADRTWTHGRRPGHELSALPGSKRRGCTVLRGLRSPPRGGAQAGRVGRAQGLAPPFERSPFRGPPYFFSGQ